MMGGSSGASFLCDALTEMTLIDYKAMTFPKSSGDAVIEIRKISLCRLFLRFNA